MNEFELQAVLTDWLDMAYPDVIYVSDLSGVNLPVGYARKLKQIQKFRGIPDLSILHPVDPFFGLFVELKTDWYTYFKTSGGLRKTYAIHMIEQASVLWKLRSCHYAAEMVFGMDEAKNVIDTYMTGEYQPLWHLFEIWEQATRQNVLDAIMAGHPLVNEHFGDKL